MKLTYGSSVFASDGEEIGVVHELVVDVRTRIVTHIVVQKGLFFVQDRLVPTDLIAATDQGQIKLSVPAKDIRCEELPAYRPEEFLGLEDPDATAEYGGGTSAWVRPLGTELSMIPLPSLLPPGMVPMPPDIEPPVPLDGTALEKGSLVIDSNGKRIGKVEECITDNEENLTHIVVQEGTVFSVAKAVPIDWITQIYTNEITLAVPESIVAKLPDPKAGS